MIGPGDSTTLGAARLGSPLARSFRSVGHPYAASRVDSGEEESFESEVICSVNAAICL